MNTWGQEMRACLRLAAPIALAQLAQITMQLTDTAVITPLGAEAIGAAGLGHNAFFGLVWPLVGVLLCLDTETSQAVGRADPRAATRAFMQAMWLWLGAVVAAIASVVAVAAHIGRFGINPEIAPLAGTYLTAMLPGIPAVAFSFASTKFLQAHGRTRPVLVIAIVANVANALLVIGLVHGHFGMPALGLLGAGYGTSASRWLVALLHLYVLRRGRFPFEASDLRPAWPEIKEMLRLGIPAGLQFALEIGIFAVAGFMIARFAPSMLAAHHILLQLATFTFMIPVGISAAAAVRVGRAIGAGHHADAAHRGNVAIASGALIMTCSALLMSIFGTTFTRLFDAPVAVTQAFANIVGVAAAFQVFDGIQVTATGALRGLGDTRSAFLANLAGHWVIAFPLALVLGFGQGMEARGIWLALACGLVVVACSLLWVWRSHTVRLRAWMPESSSAKITSSRSSTVTS